MARLRLDITMSLDGFIAGPNRTLEQPLGDGGEKLHEWLFRASGTTDADSEVHDESLRNVGAYLMGRRMFSGEGGPWGDEPWEGWWGDDPPFHLPVFVLTHHARATLTMRGGTTFTFVTDGIEAALEQARAAAGGKDVVVAGGADLVQQYLKAGLLDELQIHVVPLLLGDGVRLFENLGAGEVELEATRVIASPAVTHLKYRVVK